MFADWTASDYIAQALGILGFICATLSYQFKKHSTVLWLRTASEPLFGIQYYLLGAPTGMAMCLLGAVRNIIFTERVKKGKPTLGFQILFGIIFAVSGALTWEGFPSLLIILAKFISTFAYGLSDTMKLRLLGLPASFLWLAYNLICFSAGGIACEIFTESSIVIGFFRLDLPRIRAERAAGKADAAEKRPE